MIFTSESVSEGHPDKICDQISDAILDAALAEDRHSRVAVEALVKDNHVILAGEISTNATIDYENIVRQTIIDIGYDRDDLGFNGKTCEIMQLIGEQSADIARGVDASANHEQGAGDQGLMFGYACRETEVLMPAPIFYAHQLTRRQAELRKNKNLEWLRPDAKSQVSLIYENHRIIGVDSVVFSTQHDPEVSQKEIEEAVVEEIIRPTLPAAWLKNSPKYHINPTGVFVIGGPAGDAGLTGRKIIVDTYGGRARHGGGCFSGKDPSKVDRSGAYAARYIAKNIVAAELADACEVMVAYAIGVAEPVGLSIKTRAGKIADEKLAKMVREHFALRPKNLIEMLDLERPIYRKTAAYGHFGRNENDFSWEKTDRVARLAKI